MQRQLLQRLPLPSRCKLFPRPLSLRHVSAVPTALLHTHFKDTIHRNWRPLRAEPPLRCTRSWCRTTPQLLAAAPWGIQDNSRYQLNSLPSQRGWIKMTWGIRYCYHFGTASDPAGFICRKGARSDAFAISRLFLSTPHKRKFLLKWVLMRLSVCENTETRFVMIPGTAGTRCTATLSRTAKLQSNLCLSWPSGDVPSG